MKSIWNGTEWSLLNRDKILLHSSPRFPMIYVGRGEESVGMYRGNFQIEDYLTERIALPLTLVTEIESGYRLCFDGCLSADITVQGEVAEISFTCTDESYNRFWMRIFADSEEKIYGCGEQLSYFNLRGRNFPLWTSEPGVGRDKTTHLTWLCDTENGGAGGDYYNTNFPQPTYVSSQKYYLHVDSSAYADFDFRNESFHELQIWQIPKTVRLEAADSWEALLERMSGYFGRQPLLPDWIYEGLIIGAQGGSGRVFDIVERSIQSGIPVCGIWCQDWAGKRETSFGRRLQWDWRVNEQMYGRLKEKIEEYKQRGIRFLVYNNCYLVNDGVLYREAQDNGYFATALDGSEYLVDFGEFYCGVIDLTNPDAYEWFKGCIKQYILDLGIDGWMADFGEYLPTNVRLHSGVDAMLEHNRWPALWAKCNYDAIVESGKLGEVVYFMRAGSSGTQKYCPLLWAGDQSVDFSRHDGLNTTITAALSAGMTGCGLSHSDIGGYTSLFGNCRTKELFLRWAEMAVFTPVMRTHEGNRPDENFQYYDDDDTMRQLARLVEIHVTLKPYLKESVSENAEKGLPVQRPLFIHYPYEAETYDIQTQYLFGRDVLVAPIVEKGRVEREVYLPGDEWIHLWSGKPFDKGVHTIAAPMGQPPAFYRKKSPYASLFESLLERNGH